MGKGMRAGKKPKPRNGNMQEQMHRMQAMQAKMDETQAQIEQMEASATSGGGAVSITVNGRHEITDMKLNPEVVDPEDVEMLQDLIIAALNEAMRQMDEIASAEMNKVTAGLGIPGL